MDAERDPVVVVGHRVVAPGGEGEEVRRDRRASARTTSDRARSLVPAVFADDGPGLRRVHGELERRLEVGLVEAGEDAVGVVQERLGVEVDLAVGRVLEAMEALAGRRVGAVGDDRDFVLGEEVGERDPVADDACGIDRPAVEDDRLNVRRENLDVRRGAGLQAAESGPGDGPEALGALGEIEADLV